MNADNIAVISEGRIVEQGTHKGLIALNGRYSALVHAQDLGRREAGPEMWTAEGVDEKVLKVVVNFPKMMVISGIVVPAAIDAARDMAFDAQSQRSAYRNILYGMNVSVWDFVSPAPPTM